MPPSQACSTVYLYVCRIHSMSDWSPGLDISLAPCCPNHPWDACLQDDLQHVQRRAAACHRDRPLFLYLSASEPCSRNYAGGRSMQCTAAGSSSQAQEASRPSLSQEDLSLLSRLLRWPAPHLFPALDIARLAILEEQAAVSIASTAGPLLLSPQGIWKCFLCFMGPSCPALLLLPTY